MWRGLAKGALLFTFGRVPGGTRVYRTMTREWLGTQVGHTTKLRRVWPAYVDVWRSHGVALEGADVWIHQGGWTPFASLANYLVTGNGGVVTNVEGHVLDRYLAPAVDGAVTCELRGVAQLDERRDVVAALRGSTARDAIAAVGGRLIEDADPAALPLADASVDVCHTGGVLEHVEPATIAAWLRECRRVLRPGALMSHVVDHRDHLHHADASWPFLGHLSLSPRAYRLLCGHPLLYHNRLLPPQVRALFADAGFEFVAMRRMILPAHEYVDIDEEALAGEAGVDRASLAPPFLDISDADLRTAAAHYLYRAPS